MPWAKIDDGWWCHPKVISLSLSASGLWARALSWSCAQRRDAIPPQFLHMVGATRDHANELTSAGLWHPLEGGGWRIHDWADYQDMTLSEKRAEAGRKGGKRSAQVRGSKPTESGQATEANTDGDQQKRGSNREATEQQTVKQVPVPARPGPSRPQKRDPTSTDDDTDPDDHFEDFWTAYPRGRAGKPGGDGSKKKAHQRWRRLTQHQRDQALTAVHHYRTHVEAPNGPYACHATTWLNEERWDQWLEPANGPPRSRGLQYADRYEQAAAAHARGAHP